MNKEDLKIIYEVYKPRNLKTLHVADRYGNHYKPELYNRLCFGSDMCILSDDEIQANIDKRRQINISDLNNIYKQYELFRLDNYNRPCYVKVQQYEETFEYHITNVSDEIYSEMVKNKDIEFIKEVGIFTLGAMYKYINKFKDTNGIYNPVSIINMDFELNKASKLLIDTFKSEYEQYKIQHSFVLKAIRNEKLDGLMEIING